MKSLKQKTISGLFWSFIETASSQFIGFVSTIILSRLLLPSDFGLIGMTVVITALAQIFADGGLSQALIRKQNCSDSDYSTVFFVNILIGISIYFLIFILAPYISFFFNQPELTFIIRVISISIPINSFGIIQRTLVTKNINFRVQALITFTSSVFAFGIAIVLAYRGYGVWSLVFRSIISQCVMVILLWLVNKWRPRFVFSKKSFCELFGFGSNLLFIYTIATLFKNAYNVIIGKFYNTTVLGYYTNADQMTGLPAGILSTLFNKVAYPVLSIKQDDNVDLKNNIRYLLKPLLLVSFTFMLLLFAISKSLIPLLFGEKWIMSIPYFQILCIAYMPSILHASNQLIMNVKGKSNLFLITEIIKYVLFIPIVFIGIKFGVIVLIIGFALHFWIGFIVNAIFSKKLINYSVSEQIKDLSGPLLFACIISAITYSSAFLFRDFDYLSIILLQLVVAFCIGIILFKYVKLFNYNDFFVLIKDYIFNSFRR